MINWSQGGLLRFKRPLRLCHATPFLMLFESVRKSLKNCRVVEIWTQVLLSSSVLTADSCQTTRHSKLRDICHVVRYSKAPACYSSSVTSFMTMFMAVKRRYPAPYKVSATHGVNSRRYSRTPYQTSLLVNQTHLGVWLRFVHYKSTHVNEVTKGS